MNKLAMTYKNTHVRDSIPFGPKKYQIAVSEALGLDSFARFELIGRCSRKPGFVELTEYFAGKFRTVQSRIGI